MGTWTEQLNGFGCGELFSETAGESHPFKGKEWRPTSEDKSAAWDLYTEVRSRITTQPLAHRDGDEEAALTSIYNIFGLTRTAIKKHEGCAHFATLAIYVLNVHIRPFTACWHKVNEAGRLSSSDTCHRFRRELAVLQGKLRLFMRLLGHLAEGDEFKAGTESGIESAVVYPQYELGPAIGFGVAGSEIPVSNAADIDKAERGEVLARRKAYGLSDKAEDAVGLAISGGGIRSSTFALGVVQHLARKGIIKQVDFVSSASGGGNLGGFMSSYLNDPDNPKAGLDPEIHEAPFGKLGDVESKAIRHQRNHSKYMAEGGIKMVVTVMGQMLYGIAVNLFLTLPFILLAVLIASWTLREAFSDAAGGTLSYPIEGMGGITFVLAVLLVASAVLLPVVQNLGRNAGRGRPELKTLARRYERGWCVGLFAALIILLLWNALPQAFRLYHWLVYDWGVAVGKKLSPSDVQGRKAIIAAIGSSLPFVAGVLRTMSKKAKILKRLVMALLVLSGPVFFLVTFLVLSDVFVLQNDPIRIFDQYLSRTAALWSSFAVVTLYAGLFLNINYTSPHRHYRGQLSKTYLRRSKDGTEETEHVGSQLLSGLAQRDADDRTKAPYHFVICALNIPACKDPNLRGRKSDFFMFSKHYCGSPIVGYSATEEWEAIDGHLDLGTAVAISAAAASPQMGPQTKANISFLFAILNVRLNYWVAPPRKAKDPNKLRGPRWLLRMLTPGPLCLFKEMTGLMMGENSRFLNLSDGGHIENLSVYELLRRRCKFIIAIDTGADPKHTFSGLLGPLHLANLDLGVKIEPDLEELRIDESGNTRSHFLLSKIDYGDGRHGLFLYIKASMTGNESEFLLKYRAENPTFPHQSTGDQLYDETQFEAYRALGEHVGEDLFRSDLVDPVDPAGEPFPARPTVREWFQSLANSLLD